VPSALRADGNGDSLISIDEYLSYAGRRFMRLDANHDGIVDKAEIDADADRIARRIRLGMERSFQQGDRDGNGALTRAEADAVAAARFASLDDDKDGKLKPSDFRRRRPVGVSAGGVTASAGIAPSP